MGDMYDPNWDPDDELPICARCGEPIRTMSEPDTIGVLDGCFVHLVCPGPQSCPGPASPTPWWQK